MSHNHHLSLVPKHFHSLPRKTHHVKELLPTFPSLATTVCFLSLWNYLVWIFLINGIIQCVLSCLASLTWCNAFEVYPYYSMHQNFIPSGELISKVLSDHSLSASYKKTAMLFSGRLWKGQESRPTRGTRSAPPSLVFLNQPCLFSLSLLISICLPVFL